MIMIWKCLSSISHFVYKCINYSNFHFFSLSPLSLLLFVRTKKKILKRREKDDDDENEMYTDGREQGRAHRVTNLIPSSNQSIMCAGMPDAKENNSMVIRVAWSFRIYWTRLKTWTNVRSQPSDLVCVYNRWEPQGHLSCHTTGKMTFFFLTEHIYLKQMSSINQFFCFNWIKVLIIVNLFLFSLLILKCTSTKH
jgi:hypothetical protein